MKRIIEYLPIISICILYFGFCNIYYYYKEFNVDIYSFTSNPDILLSFFPKIVLFASIIYGNIFAQLYDTIKKPSDNQSKTIETTEPKKGKTRIEWWRDNIYWFIFFYYSFTLLISLLMQKVFHYKAYELKDGNLMFNVLFLGLIYTGIMIHERRDTIVEKKPFLIALFLILFIGHMIENYRFLEAEEIKNGISSYKKDHLSFKYKDLTIKTTDSILFIGETATHVFLYSLKDSTTSVYPFSNIDDLKIK